MKNLKNKKGFTLVELLAVIVVLAIVMGLAVVAITGVLDNARKATFVADAKSFLEGAHSLVNADDMNSMLGASSGTYAPKCDNVATTPDTNYIPIGAIKLQQGGEKSPYGNKYLGKNSGDSTTVVNSAPSNISYIKVVSAIDSTTGECNYTFSIFLSDGVYNIAETAEGELDTADVVPVTGG